jgi:glyoxylase-like metal-dependent hydrolase (beta-lactamase superfamily II)
VSFVEESDDHRLFISAVLMEDGDKPEAKGWELTALWTPGHSPGHLKYFYLIRHRKGEQHEIV